MTRRSFVSLKTALRPAGWSSAVDLMKVVLHKLGLTDYRARLGTKDPVSDKYVGHDDNWKVATEAIDLERALELT